MAKRKTGWVHTAAAAFICVAPPQSPQPTHGGIPVGVQGKAVEAESDEQKALVVRVEWMREMGIPDAEIEEFCTGGPFDLNEEMAELLAVRAGSKNNLTSQELDEFAKKNPPPTGWLDLL